MTASLLSRRALAAATLALLLLLGACAQASAADSWRIESTSKTSVAPGEKITYFLYYARRNNTDTDGSQIDLRVSLPPGFSGVAYKGLIGCPPVTGETQFSCTTTSSFRRGNARLLVQVDPSTPESVRAAAFEIEGGGAALTRSVDPVTVSALEPDFGFDAFDFQIKSAGAAFQQASGHPEVQETDLDATTHGDPDPLLGDSWPLEDLRDVTVSLPPGLIGNPAAFGRCSLGELAIGGVSPTPDCPSESQLGTAIVRINEGVLGGTVALYNMEPPPNAPARFGFNFHGNVIVLDAHLRSAGDYGLDASASGASQGIALKGSSIAFWGVPGDPAHTPERPCPHQRSPIEGGQTCPPARPPTAFFRMPSSCSSGLPVTARLNSWQHPGTYDETTISTHEGPGYPYPPGPSAFPAGYSGPESWGPPVGVDGCGQVPFQPTLDASLTTNQADSPTGLGVDIGLPSDCWDPKLTVTEAEEAICQSDMRKAQVALPQGLSLNPSAASGIEGCSPAQVGLTTPVGSSPIHFDEAPVQCPDASKIGTVEIETPLLGRHDKDGQPVTDLAGNPVLEPLTGSLYLAQQSQNPFGSLLAMYLVAEGSGVLVKQAGQIILDPSTGRVTTTFSEAPQTPFSKIHVELFGGPRAPLRTPSSCGTYTTTAELTPWSGNPPVTRESSFQITQGCTGGFDPQLRSGSENPLAGATSPFNLRLSRADGTQELAGLQVKLPPGLSGYLAGIPYCPDATLAAISGALGTGVGETNSPSCPAASQIGRLTVGAGAGPTPFYTSSGRAYLAGPYKGAPLSIAVVAPAVAGPFDLGTVVVRNAIDLDQATAQLSVRSDPLPTIIHGIPLDLRDVRVEVNREHFTLNPTSCEAKSVDATITSTQGTTAQRSNHFQVSGCERLGFKPKLSLRLKGKVNRTAHPALSATYTARAGDANLARAQVKLPPAAFLDNAHIGAVCTRPQFAAHACPPASVYGTASATTPILGYPLAGNVYLRSSDHKLPDLVADLRGPESQPIEVALSGKTDSVKGALRNTFELVPDAPVTKFNLRLFGGKRGLIQMSSGFCAHPNATVSLDAQNGVARDFSPKVGGKCGKSGNVKKKGSRHH